VIRARLIGDAEIGTEESGSEFRDQGRDRSLRLSVCETLTGPGADFMSDFQMGTSKAIEGIQANLVCRQEVIFG
jgi:hypothetical protein